MKRLLLLLLVVGVCAGWSQRRTAPNTLTPEEQKEGFELLFDGKTLDKWDLRPGLEKSWKVVDGSIESASSAAGPTLLTKEDFANYVLRAEFRAHPEINSALMLRQPRPRPQPEGGDPKAKGKKGGGAGYELQIRDKDGDFPGGSFLTASIVNVQKAPGAKIVPGQWNTFEVTMNGEHMVVIYNGKKVVDAHDSRLKTGAVGLQSAHAEDPPGATIQFRNLKIKRLP